MNATGCASGWLIDPVMREYGECVPALLVRVSAWVLLVGSTGCVGLFVVASTLMLCGYSRKYFPWRAASSRLRSSRPGCCLSGSPHPATRSMTTEAPG